MQGLDMKYFVLKPAGRGPAGQASRLALRTYAEEIRGENPGLADDLIAWIETIQKDLASELCVDSQASLRAGSLPAEM